MLSITRPIGFVRSSPIGIVLPHQQRSGLAGGINRPGDQHPGAGASLVRQPDGKIGFEFEAREPKAGAKTAAKTASAKAGGEDDQDAQTASKAKAPAKKAAAVKKAPAAKKAAAKAPAAKRATGKSRAGGEATADAEE